MLETIIGSIKEFFYTALPFSLRHLLPTLLVGLVVVVFYHRITKLLFSGLRRIAARAKTRFPTLVLDAGEQPVAWFFLLLGLYGAAMLLYPPTGGGFAVYSGLCLRVLRVGIIVLVTLWIVRLISPALFEEGLLQRLGGSMGKTFCLFITRVLQVTAVAFGVVIVINELGYNVGGLLTGIGLGGLTVALAAQDWASNLFGGFVILMDKPFEADDWISVDATSEGIVEDITFRTTRIRTFDNAQIVVPNAQLVSKPITNWSRMQKRKVIEELGFLYSSPAESLMAFCSGMQEFFSQHSEVDQELYSVTFYRYTESALTLRVHYFCTLTDYRSYMALRQEVNYRIKALAEECALTFAYPTVTAHLHQAP